MPLKSKLKLKSNQQSTPPENPLRLTDSAIFDLGGITQTVDASELKYVKFLGNGAYGCVQHEVYTYKDEEGNDVIIDLAVKHIPMSNDENYLKMIARSLHINTSIGSHDFLVQYFGAMFYQGDVILCMEKMDLDLDKFYKKLYNVPEDNEGEDVSTPTPATSEAILSEELLKYIVYCVVCALKYLKNNLKIIHRDVKPSNILTNSRGSVKLCDFGVSGTLINSFDVSNKGCNMYLSPERVNPPQTGYKFTIKSDVWSLGITSLELAIGRHPYPNSRTMWEHLNDVLYKPSPTLPPNVYTQCVHDFIDSCLKKEDIDRPDYDQILSMPFLANIDLACSKETMSEIVTQLFNLPTVVPMNCD